ELASDEFVHDVRITNDGTGAGTWPERLVFRYRDTTGGTYFRTGYFNEYGELRVAPAKHNTVALRLFQKELSSQPARNMTVPLMDVMDNRDDRNVLFALMPDGTVQARNVQSKTVCVPEGTTGWESQPDGTLWVEYGD